MRTIYKYEIPITDRTSVLMPRSAKVLHVDTQHGKACLWALVDPDEPKEHRRFIVHGTGHTVNAMAGEHVGTVLMANGGLVFHIFEETTG